MLYSFPLTAIAAAISYDDINDYCFKQMPSSTQLCDQLIAELEKSKLIDNQLKLSLAYLHKSKMVKDKEAVDELRTKIKLIYNNVLKKEPDNIDALMGSTITATNNEKIVIFRKVLKLAPHKPTSYLFLSNALLKGTMTEQQEAIAMLNKGYYAFSGNQRWSIAKRKYAVLLRLGKSNQAEAFKHIVLTDMAAEKRKQLGITPKASQLYSFCNYYSFSLGTQAKCLNEVLSLTNRELSKEQGPTVAAILSAIEITLTEKTFMQNIAPNFINKLTDVMKKLAVDNSDAVLILRVNLIYAQLSTGKEKLNYLEKAVTYEGAQPSKASYWLANELLNQGQKEAAANLYDRLAKQGEAPYNESASLQLKHLKLKSKNGS